MIKRLKESTKKVGTRSKTKKTISLSDRPEDYVSAEVALRPMSRGFKVLEGDEWVLAGNVRNYFPSADNVGATIKGLKDNGFQVLAVGAASISIGGKVDLVEKHCQTQLKLKTAQLFNSAISKKKVSFYGAPEDQRILNAPDNIKDLVEGIVIPEQPTFFTSAFPPHPDPTYFSIHPSADVPMLMKADKLHTEGVLGRGVKLALVDTGFYSAHPYYTSRGYNITTIAVAEPGVDPNTDEYGHGTGISANALGVAPGVNFVAVKEGTNPTLPFKTAVMQRPNVITNSWGYNIDTGSSTLPPELIPLEIEIANAVANGITVLFAAGNHGMKSWPASMSEVISVGGAYFDEDLNLQASSYASSFDSQIYPGRHVPDVCGLVGLAPKGVYITMPTMPNSTVDDEFSGGNFPDGDETPKNDGWLCASGTSSATPMVAGVIALLLEKKSSLHPNDIKLILEGTARDVVTGTSSTGESAGPGYDAATGHGLVDAYKAWHSIP